MSNKKDLVGKRFGRLVVLGEIEKRSKNGHISWRCHCDCGCEKNILGLHLRHGRIRSCGCLNREVAREHMRKISHKYRWQRVKHGDAQKGMQKRLYKTWCCIISRCGYRGNNRYKYYGGKGINICDEWRNNYAAFRDWALVSGYKDNLVIHRINGDGNYEPGNCTWMTKSDHGRYHMNKRLQNKRQGGPGGAVCGQEPGAFYCCCRQGLS